LGTQDTYYVGTIKSVGRIYQQTFLDTYAKVAFAKLYDRKNALIAAHLLNDRVLPFFEEHEIPLLRVLTDRGTEILRTTRAPRVRTVSGGGKHRPTAGPRPGTRRPTASANASIAPFRKSFMRPRFAKNSTPVWKNCRRTWMTEPIAVLCEQFLGAADRPESHRPG
jgi:hypothetical protein